MCVSKQTHDLFVSQAAAAADAAEWHAAAAADAPGDEYIV